MSVDKPIALFKAISLTPNQNFGHHAKPQSRTSPSWTRTLNDVGLVFDVEQDFNDVVAASEVGPCRRHRRAALTPQSAASCPAHPSPPSSPAPSPKIRIPLPGRSSRSYNSWFRQDCCSFMIHWYMTAPLFTPDFSGERGLNLNLWPGNFLPQ